MATTGGTAPATERGTHGALARTGAPLAIGLFALGLMGGGTLLTARRGSRD
ncbi:hypothetical protein [Actinomyces ruminis]|uniref:hypothetical protein n=1 Tax=Actinomyces ruminis TaxID=1937003 RepID=UPI0015D4FB21|nr:hypothetical protein [Actinomyces ruminis]